jgi:two-component system, cell cycle sensor histidine kinase and response regulator CckA
MSSGPATPAPDRLAESERNYRTIFENINDGLNIHDFKGKVLDVNDSLCKMLGYTREELIGSHLSKISGPENQNKFPERMRTLLDTGIFLFEGTHVRKDGSTVFTEINAKVVSREGDGVIQSFIRDIGDRKKMERALKESEELFRSTIEQSNEGFMMTDGNMRITQWNQAMEVIFGYSAGEMVGKHLADFQFMTMPIDQRTPLKLSALKSAMASIWSERAEKFMSRPQEMHVVSKTGERKTVQLSVFPVFTSSGICFASINRDITFRKRAEDALLASEKKFSAAFDHSPLLKTISEIETGKLIEVNDKFLEVSGYSRDEVIGKSSVEIGWISALERERIIGAIREKGNVENLELACRTKDNRLIYCLYFIEIITIDGNQRLLAVAQDITDKKRTEIALRESERRNRELLDAVPDLIFKVDAGSGIILDFKYDTPDQLLLPPDKVKGATIFGLPFSGGDLAGIKRAVSTAMTTGKKQTCTYSISFNGSDHFFEARIIREMEDTAVVIVRDITESKRAEENMIKTEKLESLGHMAGGIAHDFNNLLGGVFGYLEMAREQAEADNLKRVSHYLSKALTVFDRAKGLTRQFLTFAKGGTPVKKTGDLALLLRNTVPFALSGSNVACDLQLPKDLWPCDFDEHQMGQVIDNIVINAKQAMDKGGRLEVIAGNIELRAEDREHSLLPGRYVRIDFKDNGAGIPKELHRKIFDPFFTTKKNGTGLGLATTFSIISKHGGCIDLASEPGKGADFFIFLPASGKTVEQNETDKKAGVQGHGRILLMDDEYYVRDFGSGMLKTLGYTVETAKNGEYAIALYETALKGKKPFKAAIFDLTVIGGMGGKDAAARIRELDPHARLIVSSGYSEDPVMANPRHYGFSACIGKPYRKEELATVLSTLSAHCDDHARKSEKKQK